MKTESAVTALFRSAGEPAWDKIAELVEKMYRAAIFRRINGRQISQIADELGLLERADPLITELKGAGIMHPRPSLVSEMIRVKAPIYELNPSLCTNRSMLQ